MPKYVLLFNLVKGRSKYRLGYVLVICNHGHHPRGRAGDSRGDERGFDQCFVTQCGRRKYLGLRTLYRQKGP